MPRKKKEPTKVADRESIPEAEIVLAPAPNSRRIRFPWQTVSRAGLGIALAIGLVLGLVWLGQQAGEQVADDERYAVPFAAIECSTPPGIDRPTFLAEVRYLGRVSETVQSVDPKLHATLTTAFDLHPWVQSVDSVEPTAEGGIRVDLTFREPVLAVRIANDPAPRVVDRLGVLLPPTAPTGGIAELTTIVLPPTGPSGEVWRDPDVTRAAELAVEFHPKSIEKTDIGWRITKPDGHVLTVGR